MTPEREALAKKFNEHLIMELSLLNKITETLKARPEGIIGAIASYGIVQMNNDRVLESLLTECMKTQDKKEG